MLCSNRVSKVYDILWDKEYLKNRINLCRGTKYRSKYGNHGYFSRSIDYRYDLPSFEFLRVKADKASNLLEWQTFLV